MSEDDLSKQKNILGLSFRDLEDERKASTDDFVFIEEEIGGNTGWKRFVKWLRRSFSTDTDKKGILSFFSNFSVYMFSRFRVVFVLLSVFTDVFFGFFEKTKDSLVKRSFWGRGGFLFHVAQAALGGIVMVVVVSSLYRNPAITSANEENLDYIAVVEDDLMAMNASLNTLTPQNRERLAAVEYVVKIGDTLSSIAKTYSIDVDPILWANNLNDNAIINPGDTLLIPPSDGVLVTVKSGDTIASLAKKYDSDQENIIEANWYTLGDSATLSIGDRVFIPDAEIKAPVVVASSSTSYSYSKGSTASGYNPYSSVTSSSGASKFLSWPIAGGAGVISKYYGTYDAYVGYHRGIDIASAAFPDIVAPADGVIIFAGCYGKCTTPLGSKAISYSDSNYAWSVQIAHSNGYTTWYGHLSNIFVSSGDSVYKGQVIGTMGQSGYATGPHLHFEVRRTSVFGTDVNPLYYMY